MSIQVKRVYDPPNPADGSRILVDRIWPRGLKKETVRIDLWLKEVAPSTELRKWFDHQADRWEQFRDRYIAELEARPEVVEPLRKSLREKKTVTLLFAARDTEHNNAVVLRDYLARGC